MNTEAAEVYTVATGAITDVLIGLMEWTELLSGTEQAEARFHIHKMTETYDAFALAIQDSNGGIA